MRVAVTDPSAADLSPGLSADPSAGLAQRILHPTAEVRLARQKVSRSRAGLRARRKLGEMQQRLRALNQDMRELADLTREACVAAPNHRDEAAWPSDIRELSDKIGREKYGWGPGGLGPSENPVRDKDRQMITKMLPPSIQVQKYDCD